MSAWEQFLNIFSRVNTYCVTPETCSVPLERRKKKIPRALPFPTRRSKQQNQGKVLAQWEDVQLDCQQEEQPPPPPPREKKVRFALLQEVRYYKPGSPLKTFCEAEEMKHPSVCDDIQSRPLPDIPE